MFAWDGRGCCRLRPPEVATRVGAGRGGSVAEEHHLRERERVRVRDRHERSANLHRSGAARRAAVQFETRRTAAADDLDILPEHALRLAGPEGFHRRFLRGKAAREVRGRVPPLGTIGNLARCEDAVQESLAVALEHVGDARDVGGVEADTKDIHVRATA